ncbi:leukosialin-like [Pseudophryne corroboree]|uniref:leukosialin-like n=1 Tax=Pseudophryne corroboree TaxID=495146 RepID=UPI0030819C26
MECDLLKWTMLLLPLVCTTAMNTAEPDKLLIDGTTYMGDLTSSPRVAALLDGGTNVTSATKLIFSETPKALSSKNETAYKPVGIVASRGPFTDEPSTTSQTSLAATASQMADEDPLKKSQATPANVHASTKASTVPSTILSAITPSAASSNVPSTNHDAANTTTDQNIPAEHVTTSDYRPIITTIFIEETTAIKVDTTDKTSKAPKNMSLPVLIVVIIIILVLLFLTMIILLIRKKRRSGSQTFNTNSRKNNRKDVWAGQVPELEDGKAVHNEVTMENGKSGKQQEAGHEMTTFVSGEKKADSVVENDELLPGGGTEEKGTDKLGKEDSEEEKRPLLEGSSEGAQETEVSEFEDQFSVPSMEQELL